MKKKLIGMLLSVSIMAGTITGCGSTSTEENQKETAKTEMAETAEGKTAAETDVSGSSEARTLSFLHWRTEDKAAFEQLAKNYEAENPGLTIEIEIVPSEDYAKTLIMRAQGGEAGDVFAVNPDGDFGAEIATGALMELNDCPTIMANYEEDALGAGTRDGKTYAVVQTTNPLAIYYNKAMFEEYNLEVPATIEDFMEVCGTLKKNGVTPMAQGAGESWMPEFLIENLIANCMDDTSVFATGKLMDDPKIIDVVKTAKDIFDAGYILEGSSGINEESLLTGFAVGNYAMIATGTWSMSTIRAISEDIDFGVFNMPGTNGTTKGVSNTGLMLGINKETKLAEDAIGFVSYLTSSEALNYFCNETGQLTVAKNVKIESEDLKMAQSLLTGEDGLIAAPFHQTNPQGLDSCQLRSVSMVIESIADPKVFVEEWQAELEKAMEEI